MTSSERLIAKSLKLPVHPIVSRRSRRARASLLAAPTTTRLIQPSLETPSANTPRARARARPDRPRPRSIPARRITPPSRPRARPPRARPRPRVRRARVDTRRDASTRGTPPTDSFAPASAQIARTVSVAGSMRRSARARRRVAPRARRRRRRRRDVPSYGQTVRRSRRVPTAVDARARQRRARRSRTPRGSRDRRATIADAATTGPRRAGADARDATRRRRGFPRIQSSSDARIRGIDAVLAR